MWRACWARSRAARGKGRRRVRVVGQESEAVAPVKVERAGPKVEKERVIEGDPLSVLTPRTRRLIAQYGSKDDASSTPRGTVQMKRGLRTSPTETGATPKPGEPLSLDIGGGAGSER